MWAKNDVQESSLDPFNDQVCLLGLPEKRHLLGIRMRERKFLYHLDFERNEDSKSHFLLLLNKSYELAHYVSWIIGRDVEIATLKEYLHLPIDLLKNVSDLHLLPYKIPVGQE